MVEKAVSCYRLVASMFSSRSVQSSLAVREFCAAGENAANDATDGCVRTFDVIAPKVHQNNRSYVSSADLPSDSLRENLAWWAVTRRTLKNHKAAKIGGWALAQVWALARDNTVLYKEWQLCW